jgi:uncharacterized protein
VAKHLRYIYLHGFASGPSSRKARFFAERFAGCGLTLETPDLTPPAAEGGFEALTLTHQLATIGALVAEEPCVMIGSSMGGYLTALYAALHPGVQKLVLLAPAFRLARRWHESFGEAKMAAWREAGSLQVHHHATNAPARIGYGLLTDAARYPDFPALTQPTLIFHGLHDPVVPVDYARQFAAQTPGAQLIEYDSGHELTDCLDPMWMALSGFLGLH